MFVGFSDNGKYIRLHPFLGFALRQRAASPRPGGEQALEVLGTGAALKLGISDWGHSASDPRAGSYPCTPLHPLGLMPNTSCSGVVRFQTAVGSPETFAFALAFSGSPVLWAGVFMHSLFYSIMDLGFFLCFSINERWFATVNVCGCP